MAATPPAKRKTLRRSKQQAETVARQLQLAGHSEIKIKRVTATDWSIVWQPKPRP